MFGDVFKADMKRVWHERLPVACAAFYLAVALLYLASQDGAWVGVAPSPGEYWGFVPRGSSLPGLEGGLSPLDEAACASVAHTVFFPVLALVFLYRLFFIGARSGAAHVSLARGVSRRQAFFSKLAVSSIVLQGCYLAFSVGAALLVQSRLGFDLRAFEALLPKIALNCLVNESFILFCMAAYAWIDNGPTAAGVAFSATLLGMIAQMSDPGLPVPAHMGLWIKVCGLASLSELAPQVAVFSLASCALLLPLAYVGFTRRA